MDIQSRKILIVQEILKLQNEDAVKDIALFVEKKKAQVSKNGFEPMSMDQFDNEIEQSLNDIENGRVVEVSQLLKDIKEWD